MLSNPPFGVEWKKAESQIRDEHEKLGYVGRFGAGLPRINDGSFLFLQHMLAKMKPATEEGSRLAVVFNGSPLFTGSADSGESNIRRWIIENDWLEAIVALPDQLFYNTGISTYIWVLTNRKAKQRKGKVQMIDASSFFVKMRKSLGNKRNQITPEQIAEVTRMYGNFVDGEHCRILDNDDFGYHRVTVERPLRLNFQTSAERIARLRVERGFTALASSKKKGTPGEQEIAEGEKRQQEIIAVLERIDGSRIYRDREEFEKDLDAGCRSAGIKLPGAARKAVLAALSERDETATPCWDKNGEAEPDPDLRDYENIPLKESIDDYVAREVTPHLPDAWIDDEKTKTGYEIPFTRFFYKYLELRPLEEIDAEILGLEEKIQGMLREVMG